MTIDTHFRSVWFNALVRLHVHLISNQVPSRGEVVASPRRAVHLPIADAYQEAAAMSANTLAIVHHRDVQIRYGYDIDKDRHFAHFDLPPLPIGFQQ
jgi:hypothetical protein